MNKLHHIFLVAAVGCAAIGLSSCAHARSSVAVVDVSTIEQRWPKFINYYRQIQANYMAINESKIAPAEKRKAFQQWQQQSQRWQNEVSGDVRNAAKQIADEKNYKMVVTRQGVAYGGDDITIDVEKALKIDTSASPAPGL
jgi:Skp family chaperone for outer membrane proteins